VLPHPSFLGTYHGRTGLHKRGCSKDNFGCDVDNLCVTNQPRWTVSKYRVRVRVQGTYMDVAIFSLFFNKNIFWLVIQHVALTIDGFHE
jgi:hypothetical protein